MNGRALNDRAIEVSPSSSRVLDRAAGSHPPGGPPLLTPFPPSKNRPRPGDWTCPSCGFSNFQRRTACFRCSFPAMGAGPADPYSGGGGYGMQPGPYGGGYGGHPGMMGGPPHMHGGGYGGMGGMGGSSSSRGGIVPFRAGDWKCGNEGCGYHNFAKNVSCLRCGASRSNAAVVAEGGMQQFPGNNYGPPGGGASGYGGGSMGGSNYSGMGPSSESAYGGSSGMGGPPGGYGGQNYGGPPSTYALPSGLGAPSPYMAGGYSNSMQANAGGFDSRAEQAFNQGNQSAAGGAPGYSNGASYGNSGYGNSGYGGNDGGADLNLSFLNTGMGNLGLGNDGDRRNGQGGAKSPQ